MSEPAELIRQYLKGEVVDEYVKPTEEDERDRNV